MTGAGCGDLVAGLADVLAESRDLGFLGPGPLEPQIEHARGFASMLERAPESFLDLGSGGGLPGLVLAGEWPRARGVLLDATERRSEFLRDACDRLGFGNRVQVVWDRAEAAARRPELRGQFEVVTARSFGPPAVTAECGAPFLSDDGCLVVSEPPTDEGGRWPPAGLAEVSLRLELAATATARYARLRRSGPVADRWPRRTGIPTKRPIWR